MLVRNLCRRYFDAEHVRWLLKEFDISTGSDEVPFFSWVELPDLAILAIKYSEENLQAFWHRVVFHREVNGEKVLDSAADLDSNERTDFENIHPKWHITIYETQTGC